MKKKEVSQTKVSSNLQTYVPKKVRDELGIVGGNELVWIVKDGMVIVEREQTFNEVLDEIAGKGKKYYSKYGGGEKWLKKVKNEWDK